MFTKNINDNVILSTFPREVFVNLISFLCIDGGTTLEPAERDFWLFMSAYTDGIIYFSAIYRIFTKTGYNRYFSASFFR